MFAIVDIETCGAKFAYQKGRIIDICILVHDGISVVDKFSTLINPDCRIGSFYTNLSGITNEMVKDAPRFHEVAKDVLQFTEGKIFVAHNVSFDYNFIRDEFTSLGFRFKRDTLCTVKLSRKLLPGKKSYSLGNLCASIGIEIFDRHRAEGDAIATAKLLDILLQLKTQNKEYRTKGLQQIMTTRVENIKKYILDKLPETCGVYYFLNKEGRIIYIGKSVNMYQRAQSHFNSDSKKSKTMLNELYNVDFVETGSELISLLQESQEIKRHKPMFNRQRKKDVFTHCIRWYENEEGILSLQLIPFQEEETYLVAFTNYASARERLESWIEQYTLCLRYCGLTSDDSICFHHQIKKCNGICVQKEEKEVYNKRVKQIIQYYTYAASSFMTIERGRSADEKAFCVIENYQFVGYGYLDESISVHTINDVKANIIQKKMYPDEEDIIRGWLALKRREIIYF